MISHFDCHSRLSNHLYRTLAAPLLTLCIAALVLAQLMLAGCGGVPHATFTSIPEGTATAPPNSELLAKVLTHSIRENGSLDVESLWNDTDLTEYLREVTLTPMQSFPSRQAELAFWINAHNAWMLDLLRSNHAAHSTDEIGGLLSGRVVIVARATYSMEEIEHRIISTQFREPRAFFALYRGSRSGPKLAAQPFEDETLSKQLNQSLLEFLADSTRNRLDEHQNTLYLSSLFSEYSDELEKAAGNMRLFIRAYAWPELGEYMDMHPLMRIQYLHTDGALF